MSSCHLAWGRHLNIPLVMVATTPTMLDWTNEPLGNPVNHAAQPSLFSKATTPMNFYERLSNFILTTKLTLSHNYHVREQNHYVWKNFGAHFPSVMELYKDVSLVLINHHHALNGIVPFTPAIIPVGGLHIIDSGSALPQVHIL